MVALDSAGAVFLGSKPVRAVYRGGSKVWPAIPVAPPPPPPAEPTCTLDDVVHDMYGAPLRHDTKFPGWGAHEAALAGVNVGWDWYAGARPGPRPNDSTNPGFEGITYTHHNVWGQVAPAAGGTGERRVRVQVDLPEVYHLDAGATAWRRVRGTREDVKNFEGGYWSGANYSKVRAMSASTDFRTEADGHSWDALPLTTATGGPSTSSVGHWFYSGCYPRIPIPVGTQVAIHTRMRLVSDHPDADLGAARFVGAFCGDLYTSATTTVGSNGRNPPMAQPRHKLLTAQWRPFSYVSGTEAEIRSYPALPFVD
ncbi:hypothetical protein [Nocardioides sp. SYSU DS0663]|uniref:hypothetical protein n=1 Tax=Nocardioides sp. SYSU DS0663 TaxID=3416445 RepID=UPI003F4B876C